MVSALQNQRIYEFGEFRLVPGEELLLRNGEPVALNPKAFNVLSLLVERHGHLVTKSEILDIVWEDTFIEEGVVAKAVWFVRHALGDTSKERFIQNIPRRGYRFVFPVSVVTNGSGAFRSADLVPIDESGNGVSPQTEVPATNGRTRPSTEQLPGSEADVEQVLPAEPSRSRNWLRATLGVAGLLAVAAVIVYFGYVRGSLGGDIKRSFAVLPLRPIDSANRIELYENGVADAVINRLSALEGFTVRSLSSTRELAEAEKDALAIGRRANVDYVLESSYQLADGKVRITSRLVNVRSGAVEDTYKFEKDAAGIFAVQDAVASEAGNRLMERFAVSAIAPAKKRGTDNQEAYLAYTQGMYLVDLLIPGKEAEGPTAVELFEKAVSLDPNYARAWAGQAFAHHAEAIRDPGRDNTEHYRKARAAVDKALSLDPNESLAHTALCQYRRLYEWDISGAEEAGRRAIDLDPTSSVARVNYVATLFSNGRIDDALSHMKAAMETDPTSFSVQLFYGNALYMARRFEEAETHYKGVLALRPGGPMIYSWLIRVSEIQGKEAEAYEWTIKFMTFKDKGDSAVQRYKDAYRNGGYRAAVLERINSGMQTEKGYAYLGNKDKAFDALEKRFQERNYNLAVFDIIDPALDPLHDGPRWADLVRRVKGK